MHNKTTQAGRAQPMATALIVLAAGQGTRMNSDLPKVLLPLGGVPLFAHALRSGQAVKPARTVMVTGAGSDQVAAAANTLDSTIEIAVQHKQLGTGHAVSQAQVALAEFIGDALVLYGDTPFIRGETLQQMQAARTNGYDIVVLGFHAAEPGRYGRLIIVGSKLEKIVESKDASDEERSVSLCNSGVVLADASTVFDLVAKLGNDNASGEYYLTDIVELAGRRGLKTTVVTCDESETLGINTREELAQAEAIFQQSARANALTDGVTMTAPESVYFSFDTRIGRDTVIEPNVIFGPGVTVEPGATIRAFSHIEGAVIGSGAIVGPYARLRPGTTLSDDAKVGNFVEVKNTSVGAGAKVNHLSYVGDTSIGEAANIGAGTVTCNYNGVEKFRTEIGDRAFVGSDTMLIAPVRVGNGAITASGSVITQDVPDGALAIERSKQITKPGAAKRLFDMYKKVRNKRRKEM